MFRLKRLNVEKVVDSEYKRDRLMGLGYELLDLDKAEKPTKNKAKGGKPKNENPDTPWEADPNQRGESDESTANSENVAGNQE